MKKVLYTIAIILLLTSAYLVYQWFVAEPENPQPLPRLLTLLSTVIITIIAAIAWKKDGKNKDEVKVKKVKESIVDIDPKKDTDISVSKIKNNSTVLINKGKDSLKSRN
jgi:hypothetical protein